MEQGYASNSLDLHGEGPVTGIHQIVNCAAYGNGNDGFGFGTGWCTGTTQKFKNNWSWNNNQASSGADWVYDGNNSSAISNNVWSSVYQGVNYGNLYPTVIVSSADFVSLSSVGMYGSRQADGSLPFSNFLRLASTSDLINKGVNIGLSFMSTAPDLGAFESSGSVVNISPTANAGTDQTTTLPTNSVNLIGTGIDPDGTISTYLWTKIFGPTSGSITNANTAVTSATGLIQGVYQFELKVTDNSGVSNVDIVQIFVNAAVVNNPPTANAGADKTVVLPTSTVSLTGSGTDIGGSITAYSWTKVSGPTGGTIATATGATTSVSALTAGVYKFELKVTDNVAAIGRDTVQVTVNTAGNQVPTANAGADKAVVLPTSTVSLTGTGTDTDGTIASYIWTKVSGPTGGTIATVTGATTSVSALTAGVYNFELKVTDNVAAIGRDTVQVTVNTSR